MRPSLPVLAFLALCTYASEASCNFKSIVNGTDFWYDVSGMKKSHGWKWVKPKGPANKDQDYAYFFSVCGTIEKRPPQCKDLSSSMGYRVSTGSHIFMHGLTCVELADQTEKPSFQLIDPSDAYKGIEITYRRAAREERLNEADTPQEWKNNGKKMGFHLSKAQSEKFLRILTPCNAKERVVTYHLICSPHFFSGPLHVHEDKDQCHMNVTWPTRWGCPLSLSSSKGVPWDSGKSLGFNDIGGWYILGLLACTCMIPLVSHLLSSSANCAAGRRKKPKNIQKDDLAPMSTVVYSNTPVKEGSASRRVRRPLL